FEGAIILADKSATAQRDRAKQHKGQRHDLTNAGFIERNWSAAALGVFSRRRKAAAAGTRASPRSARRTRGCHTRISRTIRRSFAARSRAVERAVVINRTSIGQRPKRG